MSTRRFLSALAFTFISLVAASPTHAADAALVRATELEAGLAEQPDLYMVIDLGGRTAHLKARGIVLDEVQLTSITTMERSTLTALGSIEPLEVPALWQVATGPGGGSRPVLTPTLGEPGAETSGPPVTARPQLNVVAPTAYDFPVREGWRIEVGPFDARAGIFSRFWDSVASGFSRLTFQSHEQQGRSLRLGMAPADAERLHHVFRKGFPILLIRSPRESGEVESGQ